ncbi:hypothetical protein H6787_01140 [Candidatus Nomurabacteria bacterium]|nr:hypothetical protein [Candidatus Nomurabacteria bacterium]
MTIAKDFAAKLAVAFVAAAMIFSAFAPAAKAQTTEELQQMINDLLAQVAALQSSTGQGATGVASGVCPYTWTRDLSSGSTGGDVMKLQQFLNADPDTRVAATGAGSVGAETDYYGPATAAAVSKFQVKYRSDILSPANLVNPTGYFGPSSRTKANGLCVSAPVVEDDTMDDSDDSDDSSDVTLGGEADLETFEIDDADDSDIEEGQEDVEIAEITISFENGDAEISRLDLAFTRTGADAWDAFETISLWVDGDKVAENSADSKKDYLGDEDNGIIRFSGLDLIGMEDEDLVIVVAASIQNNLDAEELGTWDVDGIALRFFDADGVATTEDGSPVTDDTANFTIEVEGTDDEVIIKTSSDDPDSTTLQLDDSKKTKDVTIFAFDIDTDDSTNDITVDEIVVDVDSTEDGTTPTTTDLLISDAQLVVDGDVYDDVTITVSGSRFTFDLDEELVIDAGDRVTVEVQVDFLSLSTYLEGATVQGEFVSIDAEGADTITASGAAQGDEHTLRTEGAVLEFVSSTETQKDNSDATTTDDSGTFVLKFDVTAFEADLFINKTAASGTTMGTVGVNYLLTDGSGSVVSVGTPTQSLSSSAKTEGGQYKIAQGETETFTLTVSIDPNATGFYGAQVYSLNFKTSAGNPVTQQKALPAEDYESDPLEINN